jgi:hypothetical protein
LDLFLGENHGFLSLVNSIKVNNLGFISWREPWISLAVYSIKVNILGFISWKKPSFYNDQK